MSTISVSSVSASPKSQELSAALDDLSHHLTPSSGSGSGEGGVIFSCGDFDAARSRSSESSGGVSQNESVSGSKAVIKGRRKSGKKGELTQKLISLSLCVPL